MTREWLTVILIGVVAIAMRVLAPLALGEREIPRVTRGLALALPALVAALVVSQTFGAGQSLVVGARLAGVAAGGLAVDLRAPIPSVLVVAAAVAAGVRLLSG